MRRLKRNLTKTEYLERELERALRKSFHGKMPKEIRRYLAKRTIGRMDFSNVYQMHKSIEGYADLLTQQYFSAHD
ncbi:MAG: hypothetical protein K5656_08700 [Lachnospiraceae bacterium]|nr:hypothetical protein [Lachnospiraceae bacterium]